MKPAKKKKSAKKSAKRNSTRAVAALKRNAKKNSTPRLTRQLQAQVMNVYEAYWHNYLIGNVEAMAPLLTNEYTQVGSAESEVFFTKKEAVKFLYDTIGQVAGKVEMRNRVIKVEPHHEFILVTELTDLYVLIEKKWTFHSKFRASSLMQKKDEGWKFIYQHSSFPDIRAKEGENIAIEKIAAENLQLRDAVKRRTIELEQKNHELKIEAAMEKVRVRSLAMQKPEELVEVAEVLRKEMGALGVEELETSSIYIIDESKGTTECWYAIKDIRGKNKKLVTDHMTLRLEETWVGRQMKKFHRSKENRASIVMKGEDRKEWINHCAEKSSVLQGYYGGEIPERTYHLLKFSNGFMGAASPGEISQESWDLLQRATAVFSFAYKRFNDLQKAEAQARESEIQLALERVRARTMAMHDSAELSETAKVLFDQLKQLGADLWTCGFATCETDNAMVKKWMASPLSGQLFEPILIPGNVDKREQGMYDAWKNGIDIHSFVQEGEELAQRYKNLSTPPYVNENVRQVMESGIPLPVWQINYVAPYKHGYLLIIATKEFDETGIFIRFAKVFEQTYTRFLDLQKAEAQAREAQIETALERVRSRSMGMQKSQELKEVIQIVYEQFVHLNINIEHTGFILDYKERDDLNIWLADQFGSPSHVIYPYTDSLWGNRFKEAREKGIDFFTTHLNFVEKNRFLQELFKYAPGMPEEGKEIIFSKPGLAISTVLLENVSLYIENLLGIPYSDEDNAILMRFGKVFQQTYTRFLDLQKAEAQAREAQIEASLERVRSRSMGMQKSEELKEVIKIVYQQLTHFKINLDHAGFVVDYTPGGDWHFWIADEHDIPSKITHPWFESVWANQFNEAKEKGEDLFATHLNFEEKNKFYHELLSYVPGLPQTSRDFYLTCPGLAATTVLFENVSLYMENFSGTPYTDEENKILMSFGKVFQQTYTRFLDLQKVEAQAREARIENALEKVRSRTMAMQKSNELAEAASLLFEQVGSLGTTLWTCGFNIWDEDRKSATSWMAGEGKLLPPFKTSSSEHIFLRFYEAAQRGESFYVLELKGEALVAHYRYMQALPGIGDIRRAQVSSGIVLPTIQIIHIAFFTQGYLMFITFEPVPEMYDVFKRFAKVFEQTYTRFLDLQKAEAQARESQIQLALERVRARTMAMHHSSELADTATILFQQIKELGFELWSCGFGIWKPEVDLEEAWMSTGDLFPIILVPFKEDPTHLSIYEASQRGESVFEIEVKGEVLTRHYDWLMSQPSFKRVFGQIENSGIVLPTVQWKYAAFFKQGYLHLITTKPQPDIHDISSRFAKVFEQTYTRFLDLQKAEAQAREAQIEAGLERVRSKTMAMHNSQDVGNTVASLFDELVTLGLEKSARCGIGILDESDTMELWTASTNDKGELILSIGHLNMTLHPLLKGVKKTWSSKKESFTYELQGEDLLNYFTILNDYPDYHIYIDVKTLPEKIIHNSFYFTDGLIYCFTPHPISGDFARIFNRFAGVFGQTYKRYRDLQKAEAQAKEAQIEAALERVRSASMAMHKSDELLDVVNTVFERLRELNLTIDAAAIFVFEQDGYKYWFATTDPKYPTGMHLPFRGSLIADEITVAREKNADFITRQCSFEEKNKFFHYIFENTDFGLIPEERRRLLLECESMAISVALEKYSGIQLNSYTGKILSQNEVDVVQRFSRVFEQAYTRFLDLQKAEAQAHEAIIEVSLERVRAKTMAMHSSDDVSIATATMFTELEKLGVENQRCGIANIRVDRSMEVWSVTNTDDGKIIKGIGSFSMDAHPLWQQLFEAWKEKEGLFQGILAGKEKEDYIRVLNAANYLSEPIRELPDMHFQSYLFNEGGVWTYSLQPHSEEQKQMMIRFTSVFSLTFRRYQDLKQAEAQAKEAQIEASLERVRTQAMAMHKADDLLIVSEVLYKELKLLGIDEIRNAMILIHYEKKEFFLDYDYSSLGGKITQIPYKGIPQIERYIKGLKENEKNNEGFLELIFSDEEFESWKDARKATGQLDDPRLETLHALYYYHFNMGPGDVSISTFSPLQKEKLQVLERFRNVFKLPYQRYLDIEIAATQAREAQIEAALERVRSRTMAMQRSMELAETASLLFQQVKALSITVFSCGFHIWIKDEKASTSWMSLGETILPPNRMPHDTDPTFRRIYEAANKGLPLYEEEIEGTALTDHYNYMMTLPFVQENVKALADAGVPFPELPKTQVFHAIFFNQGYLMFITLQKNPENAEVFKRFTGVFEQTYTRFLDLQKAEEQTREAKIEASLERVRSKAMAMHSSEDLMATINSFYHELELFSITPRRCGVGLLDKDTHMAELSTMNTTEQGRSIEVIGSVKLVGHPVLEAIYENWLLQNEYHPVLRGNAIKEYYHLIRPQVAIPEYPNDAIQFGYFFYFAEGGVYAWTEKEMTDDELKIYRRFTSVLSLTYKRYKDLKDAEARARLAIRESSLDRVRAGIASMRTAEDLQRITPLVWHELITLGVPFFRCGVFIVNEAEKKIHTYLTNPQGKSLAVLNLSFDSSETNLRAVEHWRLQKVYTDHWNKEQFTAFAKSLIDQGQIETTNTYQGGDEPPESLTLQFIPFAQGMLYVGSAEPLLASQIELVQALAEAFSVAYARYEDFTRLESAKQQIEKTLVDLKQTQAQLVQSEKMASLGELTAGIAHEIQNPLNFVNNFSEVSNELLDEMREEIERGNYDEAKAITDDVKLNLEKILHHGKRADGIVKGMLQHSRSSAGQKELTDINALADEYLRLAYHGLRAKDKSFNAKFEADLDPALPNINVVRQDIGRVILNLINNAFYAVSEKKKRVEGGYEPTVKVRTKLKDHQIEISVIDNGGGIPSKIVDKIFQPFFTTKPTGQGTGLGLSLSYDIVKAHGGKLELETQPNVGCIFIIILPTP